MNEVEEKSVRRWKASFVVAVALVGTLAISSLWLYMRSNSFQIQVGDLETENVSLQTKVSNLTSVKSSLQSKVDDLNKNITDLQNQIDSLETKKTNLQNLVNSLTDDKADLQDEIDDLDEEIEDLESEIWDLEWEIYLLEEPQLHRVETYWSDNHPLIGSPYVNYYGIIFNSGSYTALNVVITVRIYDSYDTLLKTEEIHMGSIWGKDYQTFDVDIGYSGDADYITTVLDWD